MNRQPIDDQTWAAIRAEFTLPRLELVRRRLSELMEDLEPLMRQLVRVFIDDGTYCPGFQFLPVGQRRRKASDRKTESSASFMPRVAEFSDKCVGPVLH